MYFYCTQKVGNYHKVGISRSFSGIKNRLSDYRQISPKTNIKNILSHINYVKKICGERHPTTHLHPFQKV